MWERPDKWVKNVEMLRKDISSRVCLSVPHIPPHGMMVRKRQPLLGAGLKRKKNPKPGIGKCVCVCVCVVMSPSPDGNCQGLAGQSVPCHWAPRLDMFYGNSQYTDTHTHTHTHMHTHTRLTHTCSLVWNRSKNPVPHCLGSEAQRNDLLHTHTHKHRLLVKARSPNSLCVQVHSTVEHAM